MLLMVTYITTIAWYEGKLLRIQNELLGKASVARKTCTFEVNVLY